MIHFCIPGSLQQRTGGYIYDRKIIEGLRAKGWQIIVYELPGKFPITDQATRKQAELIFAQFPKHACVVIDGLAAAGLEPIVAKVHANIQLAILLHLPFFAEIKFGASVNQKFLAAEKRVLHWARRIIVPSSFVARELNLHDVGLERIAIIPPGVMAIELPKSDPKKSTKKVNLLCVAAIVPIKGHCILIDALSRLREKPWFLRLIGSTSRAPQTYQNLCQQINDLKLAEKIGIIGECEGFALASAYRQADIFVLPSYYESYGMVLGEACAYGLPILASKGGAISETIASLGTKAALLVEPGDPQALAKALEIFMDDESLRRRMILEARSFAGLLRSWNDAVDEFEQVMMDLCSLDKNN